MRERDGLLTWARAELQAHRPWAARDALAGRLAQRPADQEVLDLLARCWLALGDEERAGRYWFLTDVQSVEAEGARAAFRQRFGDDAYKIASALKVRAPMGDWPDEVQQRLAQLAADIDQQGHRWTPGNRPRLAPAPRERAAPGWWLVALAVLLATVGVWIVGVYTLIRQLFQ
jgi:hypothetical protein